MIAPSESNTSSYGTDRRSCSRQRVLFSSVVLSEGNCGRVLNISPHGLALQTDTELVGEEFPFRFKFSPSLAWVEAKGRVAWRNDSKNVVGIEFVDLTDEVQEQIQTWMDWRKGSSETCKTNVSSANAPLNERAGTGEPIATHEHFVDSESAAAPAIKEHVNVDVDNQMHASQTPGFLLPPAEAVDRNAENQSPPEIAAPGHDFALPEAAPPGVEDQNLPSMTTAVQDRVETQEFLRAGEVKIARGVGTRIKLIGLVLLIILMFSVIFFRRNHSQAPAKTVQSREVTRAPRPPARPDQTTLPAANPSATSSAANPPAGSPAVTRGPSAEQKPAAHGPAFVLQVAAMLHEENANALATTLRDSNFPAFVMRLPTERFHHVLVGPFNSASAAIETQNKLEQRGYKPIRTEWKVSSR